MKKTNIRINNLFIFEYNHNLYISDIDDINIWKKFKNMNLKKFIQKENDKTNQLNLLFKEFNIQSNVNFIINDKKIVNKDVSSPIKIIKIDKKSSLNKKIGGWGATIKKDSDIQIGGWGATIKKDSDIQIGGKWSLKN